MNPVILNLVPSGTGTPAGGAVGPSAKGTAKSADFFRVLVANGSRAKTSPPRAAQAGPAAVTGDAKAQNALEARIAKMIDSGASQSDIITALSAALATSVTRQLDATAPDARAELQTLFAKALAPPGGESGTAESVADRARTLAQRFLRLKSVANTIAGQHLGQQNRFAGNFLDAHRAKDIPARTTTSDAFAANPAAPAAAIAAALVPVATAQTLDRAPTGANVRTVATVPSTVVNGIAAPALSMPPSATAVTAAALSAVAPRVAAPTGDITAAASRTVKLGATPAIGFGGATLLGRTLARAALAADARQTLAATNPGDESAPASIDAAPSNTAHSDTVSAFVKAFEGALNASTAAEAQPAAQPDAQLHPLPASLHVAADAPAAIVPAVAPFTIERADGGSATPVATAVPTPIDHSAIADQVLRGAFMRNVGQSSEMRLNLVPESLGDVSVKLVVTEGNVAAHVIAQTPEVRDALVAAQPQLGKSLADAGLKLTNFTVDLSGSGFAGFSQQQNDRSHNGQQSRRSGDVAQSNDPTDEALLEAIPSFGPSIGGAQSAGDYNYLA